MKKKKQKTLAALKKIAWQKLSLLVRLDHATKEGHCRCVTCGRRDHWTLLQAGHAIGGRHAAVLFDEDLIYPQCIRCNIFLRGDYGNYALFLIKKHGRKWYEQKQEQSKRMVKEGRAEMLERIDGYNERLESHRNKHLRKP